VATEESPDTLRRILNVSRLIKAVGLARIADVLDVATKLLQTADDTFRLHRGHAFVAITLQDQEGSRHLLHVCHRGVRTVEFEVPPWQTVEVHHEVPDGRVLKEAHQLRGAEVTYAAGEDVWNFSQPGEGGKAAVTSTPQDDSPIIDVPEGLQPLDGGQPVAQILPAPVLQVRSMNARP